VRRVKGDSSHLKVTVVSELTPERAIPVIEIRDKPSFFQNLSSPHVWTDYFRASLKLKK
jgi:hypothetical protein